jgi:AAA-like domain
LEKFFNTTGPNKADMHYTVDPLHRWDLQDILMLIQQEKYFVLHAPRQTGKTSCMLALRDYLNETGEYQAVYANVETAQVARDNVDSGIQTIMGAIASRLRFDAFNSLLVNEWTTIFHKFGSAQALNEMLGYWAEHTNKPIVLFIDEVDALVGDTLISLLRQIRAGYPNRPKNFPASIVLCGVRDVRDYRIHSAATKEIITGGSAFNIKAESLRLGNFTQTDIKNLYLQHTEATGQVFEPAVFDLVWHYTAGQPWLVNALAHQVTSKNHALRDRTQIVTVEDFKKAKESLILRRDTHLDQLADKLREERVKRVIQPILSDEGNMESIPPDDIQYVIDLGLVNSLPGQVLRISNEIYQEIIPRQLTWSTQSTLVTYETPWYLRPDGSLDMHKLLTNFQEFFRQNAEYWIERFDYKEAGPQLLLQAFLQRIVNGGGRINREYGLGRRRTDLFIEYDYPGGRQNIVLELKILRNTLAQTLTEGLQQTADYMDKCGTKEGHLLIFDRTPDKPWAEKIFHRTEQGIEVWGC